MIWLRGIRLRLLGLMIIGTAALGAFGLVSYNAQQNLEEVVGTLASQRIPITDKLGDLRVALNASFRFSWAALAMSASGERREGYLKEVEQAMANFDEAHQKILTFSLAPKSRELVEASAKPWAEFKKYAGEMKTHLRKGSSEGDREARELMITRFPSIGTEVTSNLREVAKITDERNGQFIGEAREKVISATKAMIAVALISMLALWSLGLFVAATTSRRLTTVSDQVDQSAREVHGAADSLAGASQQLSSSAEEQASALEETSASLEELTGMVESNLKSAEQSVEESVQVKEISQKANGSMEELVASMKEIEQSNEKIEKLAKRIEEIGEKTELIDEIVFQTKLLSFNASVEAERAGEHGRGFAVVAQEVGNLAQMSGKSAVEIASIVKEAMKEARSVAEENRSRVSRGAELCEASSKELQSMQAAAVRIEESSQQILRASKEQSTGLRQIATSVEALNQATQQNAATSEESASASTELSEQARSLGDLVSELFMVVEGRAKGVGDGVGSNSGESKKSGERFVAGSGNVMRLEPRNGKKAIASLPQRNAAENGHLKKAAGAEGSQSSWESL
jgi:hypothetical protein